MKKEKKITLVKVFKKKDKIFWTRTLGIKNSGAHWLSKKIVLYLVIVWYYLVAGMHFGFETFMWVFNKKQFRQNLSLLNYQSEMKLSLMKSNTISN